MMPRSVTETTGISGSITSSSTAMIAASSSIATSITPMNLHPFEGESDSLSDADAHRRKRQFSAIPLQFLGRGQREAGTGHSERVAEGDCAPVRIHSRVFIRDAELTKNGQALSRERLVEFDHVEGG